MEIALVQMAPELADPETTCRRLEPRLQQCQGADLVVLPELCPSGYNFRDRQQAQSVAEAVEDSPFLAFLESQCRRFHFGVATGFLERDGNQLFNAAVLVTPEGVLGLYRKLHLFGREKEIFEPGNLGVPVVEFRDARLAMLVCFDWAFPEVWRLAALHGADLIAHPSNLVLPGFAQSVVPSHAVVNRVFVATANRIGQERDLRFTGLSQICDPKGNLLARASQDREEVLRASLALEMSRDKWMTPQNHLFEDRRPEQYRDLLNTQGKS